VIAIIEIILAALVIVFDLFIPTIIILGIIIISLLIRREGILSLGFKKETNTCPAVFVRGVRGKFLSNRIPHPLAAYQVHVQVEDHLSAMPTCVHDQAISVRVDPFFFGKFPGDREEPSQHGFIFGQDFIDRFDVLVWHEQKVNGRDRVDVVEGGDVFVFVNDSPGHFPLDDLAEDTLIHEESFGKRIPVLYNFVGKSCSLIQRPAVSPSSVDESTDRY
jgi:hypothetical protein